MKPLRLAVIFDQQIRAGGGYQQALNAALLVRELNSDTCEPLFFTTHEENLEVFQSRGLQAELIQYSVIKRYRTHFRRFVTDARVLKLLKRFERYSPFERTLIERGVDLVYFLAPSSWAHDLEELNYIATVWDLCHRDEPEFPEVRWNRQLELREKINWTLLPRATAIFADSELGKRNLVHRYGLDEEKVHVLPFQAASATRESIPTDSASLLNVAEKYDLDMPYVFYPAQFWAHKNHVYLLEGLHSLEKRYGLRLGAIFAGGDQGNYAFVESYARRLKLASRVRMVGFVKNEEIVELYRQSLALVMPSYFGPTNLPPLEAFELGVPVLYSDKAGLRDQVGDAALLMNLNDPNSMADHLKNLVDHPHLRKQLINAGRERLKLLEGYDRLGILNRVIAEFRWRRLTWR